MAVTAYRQTNLNYYLGSVFYYFRSNLFFLLFNFKIFVNHTYFILILKSNQ